MTRAVLTATEARAHAEGTLTEIRRRVDMDDRDHRFLVFVAQTDDGGWSFADVPHEGIWWAGMRTMPGKMPPLGQPGTVLDGVVRITAVRVERAAAGWEWVYSVENAS